MSPWFFPPKKEICIFFELGFLVFSLNTWVLGFSFFVTNQDALGFVQANTTWSSRLRPRAYSPRRPLGGIGGWPLAEEFSSSQVGSLPYSVTKHAAVALAEWCGVWVGWFGWLNVRKARFFFVKKMGDSWDRPVIPASTFFLRKWAKPLGFLDWILSLCTVNWPCDVCFEDHGHMVTWSHGPARGFVGFHGDLTVVPVER